MRSFFDEKRQEIFVSPKETTDFSQDISSSVSFGLSSQYEWKEQSIVVFIQFLPSNFYIFPLYNALKHAVLVLFHFEFYVNWPLMFFENVYRIFALENGFIFPSFWRKLFRNFTLLIGCALLWILKTCKNQSIFWRKTLFKISFPSYSTAVKSWRGFTKIENINLFGGSKSLDLIFFLNILWMFAIIMVNLALFLSITYFISYLNTN